MSEFTWTSPDGVDITLPPMSRMTAGMLRKNRNKDEIDFMFSILEELLDADTLAKVDALTMPETESLFKEWQANGGVTVPQS